MKLSKRIKKQNRKDPRKAARAVKAAIRKG